MRWGPPPALVGPSNELRRGSPKRLRREGGTPSACHGSLPVAATLETPRSHCDSFAEHPRASAENTVLYSFGEGVPQPIEEPIGREKERNRCETKRHKP